MTFEALNTTILRSSLSLVAALLFSTAAMAQDAGTDEGALPDDTVVQITHELYVPDDTPDDTNGIAVGEPDPNGDETIPDELVDEGTDVDGTDDEGVEYTFDPDACIDCNVITTTSEEPRRGVTGSELERTNTPPVVLPLAQDVATRSPLPLGGGSDAANVPARMSMTECLSRHARSSWICEWPAGANQ